jgi:hypothetical protein
MAFVVLMNVLQAWDMSDVIVSSEFFMFLLIFRKFFRMELCLTPNDVDLLILTALIELT